MGVSGRFTPEERSPQYPPKWRLGGSQSQSAVTTASLSNPRWTGHEKQLAVGEKASGGGARLCVDWKVLESFDLANQTNTKLPIRLRCQVSQRSQRFPEMM
jgi:hypothetical protein